MSQRQFAVYLLVVLSFSILPAVAESTPQFARKYRVDCSSCHSAPPRLNERGLRFVAAGYRFETNEPSPTVPLAVWNTADVEWRHSGDLVKGFPSRIELISAGPIGSNGGTYFAEWRALSQSVAANGRLLNRSGRFEDLFLRMPVTSRNPLSLTVGQFRTLTQVDVSLRLGLSEPLVFSSSVPGRRTADARLTGLRAFSASGRQPAIRAEYQLTRAQSTADGWVLAATLPLTGELTIPFTDAASFEFEARPKGVFLESYRRSGLRSVGGTTSGGASHCSPASAPFTRQVSRTRGSALEEKRPSRRTSLAACASTTALVRDAILPFCCTETPTCRSAPRRSGRRCVCRSSIESSQRTTRLDSH
jgi:hypothetical protein